MNMKLTAKLLAPYFAVGVFWCVFSNAWLAMLAYHAQILFWSRTHLKTPFGCDRLQSPWDCVVGKNGSRRTSVRLRALFTSGLAHTLFARARFKISFEIGSSFFTGSL
jgi:hypothetical protein